MSDLPFPDLLKRLGRVRLLSVDVDGVLTDGGLYYTEDGRLLRKFNVKDGMGMKRLREAGVEVAMISAGTGPTILERGRDLGLEHVFSGVEDKLATLSGLCRRLGITLAEVAHVGDDLNDVPVLNAVGCPLTVADAVPEARDAAVFATAKGGGEGAVREICDLLIEARRGPG